MTQVLAEAEESVVWAICPYLRMTGPCQHCPRWEHDDHLDEPVQRGCFAMAHEVVMICRFGNPWGRIV